MKFEGITMSDGRPLELNIEKKGTVLGYWIVHSLTGRILPGTDRSQIYSKFAAMKRMGQIATMYNVAGTPLDIWEYELKEVYPEDLILYKTPFYYFIPDAEDWLDEDYPDQLWD